MSHGNQYLTNNSLTGNIPQRIKDGDPKDRIVKTRCIERALVKIRRGLVDTIGTLSSWGSMIDYCQWRRIVCNDDSGHVTQLHLSAIDFPQKLRDVSFSWIPSSRISNTSSSLYDL
ncbi:hypothetical protein ACET3Z_023066 [Daucus carota]